MTPYKRILTTGAAITALLLGGGGIAAAQSGTDDGPNEPADSDTPLTGSDLDRASAAALEHTGGGEVVDSEIGDDGAAYGIEIKLDDGSQVEVNLDAEFNVIGSEPDDD
ncbi:MAG: PepSY domain-containing protein [Acidimicrobiales bacterium]